MNYLIYYIFERPAGIFVHGNCEFNMEPAVLGRPALELIRDHIRDVNELRNKEAVLIANVLKLES
jgi:hypothetical protein